MSDVHVSRQGILGRLGDLLIIQKHGAQGEHIDPDLHAPPDIGAWGPDQRNAWFSDEMKVLRECVCSGDDTPRHSVLKELAEFHHETIEAAYQKCIDWEK